MTTTTTTTTKTAKQKAGIADVPKAFVKLIDLHKMQFLRGRFGTSVAAYGYRTTLMHHELFAHTE